MLRRIVVAALHDGLATKIDGSRFPLGYESLNIALTEVALVTRRQRFILLIGFTLAVNAVVLPKGHSSAARTKEKQRCDRRFSVCPRKKAPIRYKQIISWRGLLCVHQKRPLGKH